METPMNNTPIVEQPNLEQATDFEPALASNEQHSIVRVGDTLICSGSVPMVIPQGGAHVRQVEIRLPLFAQKPTVTATLHSPETPGNIFGIFSIKTNRLGNQTQIVITASNVQGAVNVPFTYFCDFVVIGKAA